VTSVNAVATRLDDVGVALVDAASSILASEGANALTVRRIASEAGVSTMNVYSRFGGKDGVVEQLYLQGFGLLAQAMTDIETTDDPLADLDKCSLAYRRFALEHSTLYEVMFMHSVPDYEPTPSARDAGRATLVQLAERLERAMDSGQLRRIEPYQAAAIVWSACHGVVSLEIKQARGVGIDWEEVYADTAHAVIDGLRTR
jgi:AcrR family transcriptional regulator